MVLCKDDIHLEVQPLRVNVDRRLKDVRIPATPTSMSTWSDTPRQTDHGKHQHTPAAALTRRTNAARREPADL